LDDGQRTVAKQVRQVGDDVKTRGFFTKRFFTSAFLARGGDAELAVTDTLSE
jgi:hypothetical protein